MYFSRWRKCPTNLASEDCIDNPMYDQACYSMNGQLPVFQSEIDRTYECGSLRKDVKYQNYPLQVTVNNNTEYFVKFFIFTSINSIDGDRVKPVEKNKTIIEPKKSFTYSNTSYGDDGLQNPYFQFIADPLKKNLDDEKVNRWTIPFHRMFLNSNLKVGEFNSILIDMTNNPGGAPIFRVRVDPRGQLGKPFPENIPFRTTAFQVDQNDLSCSAVWE